MAATKGIDVIVYVDDVPVACQTGATLTMSSDSNTYSCKDTIWKYTIASNKEWSIAAESMYQLPDAADTSGFTTLFNAFTNSTEVTVKFKVKDALEVDYVTDDVLGYTGLAYITEMEYDAPQDNGMTASMTFMGSGALTEIVVTP